MMAPPAVVGVAARIEARFASKAPKGPRRWATPGDLACALNPDLIQTDALKLIDKELVNLIDNPECSRLMISMPPQEGKSERVSHYFPEWLLDHDKELRIAVVSYTDEMARRHGAEIKLDVERFNGDDSVIDLGIRLRKDSRAAGRWNIEGHRGSLYCVGIGGSLTGKAVDILIIDDPIKNLKEAHSEAYRQELKDFWRGVCIPRISPATKVIVVSTRWHDDDLSGWLLINEPGQWRHLNIPAQCESHDDPLGRKLGEFMKSARGDRLWDQIKRNVGSYVWAALYQGHPSPAAGGLFKRRDLRYWSSMPPDPHRHGTMRGARVDLGGRMVYLDDCWRFLTVDLAASVKTSADWTVGGVWAVSPEGDLILLDGDRGRIEERDHWGLIRPLKEKWNADVVYVESRMFGTTMVYEAGRAGVPIRELQADTDKVTRALPATVRAENGRLWMPTISAMSDVDTWVKELVSFPNAKHDDCVDVVAYAAKVIATEWLSQVDKQSTKRTVNPSTQSDINTAYESATGQHANGTDYGSLRW